jgi:peptide chain release factor 1
MIDKLNVLEHKFEELSKQLADPSVISNPALYQKHAKTYSELSEIVDKFREYKEITRSLEETRALLNSEDDPEMRKLAGEELDLLEDRAQTAQKDLQVLLTPKDPNDEKNVVLEIRAGTGGNEATLLQRNSSCMYSRYAERSRWQVEIIEEHASEVGGLKEIIAMIEGDHVYSKLKYESGVHRVQRSGDQRAAGCIRRRSPSPFYLRRTTSRLSLIPKTFASTCSVLRARAVSR